jgi:hypothetical protein
MSSAQYNRNMEMFSNSHPTKKSSGHRKHPKTKADPEEVGRMKMINSLNLASDRYVTEKAVKAVQAMMAGHGDKAHDETVKATKAVKANGCEEGREGDEGRCL